MFSEHSDDSPATAQRKYDWREAKFVEQIWRAHGFDTMMVKSLVNSWVNPTRRLLDDDYKPVLIMLHLLRMATGTFQYLQAPSSFHSLNLLI